MGVMGADNAWWLDVLENGPASVYADYFDIDWQPAERGARRPRAGAGAGRSLRRGARARRAASSPSTPTPGAFAVALLRSTAFRSTRASIRASSTPRCRALPRRRRCAAAALAELRSVVSALRATCRGATSAPPTRRIASAAATRRSRKRRLARPGARASRRSREAIARALRAAQRRARRRRAASTRCTSCSRRRPTGSRTGASPPTRSTTGASSTSTTLAALRMENEAVFEATHRADAASSSRDGQRRRRCASTIPTGCTIPRRTSGGCRSATRRSARASDGATARPLYVVVEKIAAPSRAPARDWPVHGTTGYRFANVVNGLFVDAAREARLDRAYAGVHRRRDARFDDIALPRASALIMRTALASELTVLASRLARIARADRAHARLHAATRCAQALAEVVACFPGVPHLRRRAACAAQDRRYIDWAVAAGARRSRARRRERVRLRARTRCSASCRRGAPQRAAAALRASRCKFQQFTAPVMAKGVEDTAFYRYNRLVSLNDVGGDPGRVRLPGRRASTARARDRARALAAHDAGHLDARQQALRGRARAHRRALRDAGRVAPAAAPLEPHEPQPQARRSTASRAPSAQRRVPALPDAARQPARRRRSTPPALGAYRERIAGLHAEGGARGQGRTRAGSTSTRPTRRRVAAVRRRAARGPRRATCSSTTCARRCARWRGSACSTAWR